MIVYYSITGNIWYTGINGAEINGSLINVIFSSIAYLVAFGRMVYVTLINVILVPHFGQKNMLETILRFMQPTI